MTIHYEHMTSKDDVREAFKKVITFMGQFGHDADSMNLLLNQQIDRVKSMVKEPEYDHGMLMARICGVEAAKKLHQKTRAFSEALGYKFDAASGHWSLNL